MSQLSAATNELAKMLGQVPLKSLVRHDGRRDYAGGAEVVTVSTTDHLQDVIKTLFKFKIASVPVVTTMEATASSLCQRVVLGFVDMVDILSYMVAALPPSQEHKADAFELAGRSLLESPIVNVINFSQKDKIVPLSESHPVLEVLQFFSKGTHRVLLFDQNKALTGLISQSDVIRLLNSHFSKGEFQAFALSFEKYFQRLPVTSILPTDSIVEAINKLATSALRSLAVVDSSGKLVGNFSSSDICYAFAVSKREGVESLDKETVLHEIFSNLRLTVLDYLTKFRPKSLMPFMALPNITVGQVSQAMADGNLQLWIVDDLQKKVPIGVITQTDLCRCFAEMCQA